MKFKLLVARLLLAVAATAAVLIAFELGLRLFGPAPPPREDTLRTFTEYDPDLGWKGRSGASGPYRTRRFSTFVTLTRDGWRDDERAEMAAPAGAPAGANLEHADAPARRIMLLGDSFAWGYGVNRGEMFADRVEALLPGTEVMNFGVSGYGTDQELLLLEKQIERVLPAVVVVEFAVENDLSNIASAESYGLPKPRFVLEQGALRLSGIPVPRVEQWDRASRGSALKAFLGAHVRLYSWAAPRWAAVRTRAARWVGRGGEDVVAMRRVRLLLTSATPRVEESWRLAEALLAAIRDRSARVGAPVVLLDVPDRLQVDDALWEEAVAAFGLDRAAYDRDLPERRLAAICARLGIELVLLLEPLRARLRAGENLYIADDIHWNAKGHAVAADELARALRAMDGPAEARQ